MNAPLTKKSSSSGPRKFFRRKNKKQRAKSIRSDNDSSSHRAQIERELTEVFKKFDLNGDGMVSAPELGNILATFGYHAPMEDLHAMIEEMDGDNDGCINLDEFIELNTKDIDSDEALESLKEAFLVFDMDKNGLISAEELQNVLKSLGDSCSISECKKMISGVDADGDGSINFDEFRVMMLKGSRLDTMGPTRQGSLKLTGNP